MRQTKNLNAIECKHKNYKLMLLKLLKFRFSHINRYMFESVFVNVQLVACHFCLNQLHELLYIIDFYNNSC